MTKGKNVFVSLLLTVIISACSTKEEMVWIELGKTFEAFEMKKELEQKYNKTEQARKVIIDSLQFELQVLTRQIKAEKGKDKEKLALYEVKREHYYRQKEAFENENAVLQQQYNAQILTQLNQYLKDYGEKKGYGYILGADGNGNLMYATDKNNITEDVILFINEKYNGIESD